MTFYLLHVHILEYIEHNQNKIEMIKKLSRKICFRLEKNNMKNRTRKNEILIFSIFFISPKFDFRLHVLFYLLFYVIIYHFNTLASV